MDTGIRVSIGAGVAGFILSVLIAIFSRVPFGVLLVRALLLGLGFAVLAFGIMFLLRKTVPDLFDPDAVSGDDALESADSGSLVNIVLPGDDGLPERESAVAGYAAADEVSEELEAVDEAGRHPANGTPRRYEPEPGFSEEPDLGSLASEVNAIRRDSLVAADPRDSVEPAAQPKPKQDRNQNASLPRPRVSVDDLDVLPDLDGLSGSFESMASESEGDDAPPVSDATYSSGSFSGGASGTGGSGGNAAGDPVVIAKAVQTLLRRDQKGQ